MTRATLRRCETANTTCGFNLAIEIFQLYLAPERSEWWVPDKGWGRYLFLMWALTSIDLIDIRNQLYLCMEIKMDTVSIDFSPEQITQVSRRLQGAIDREETI